MANKQKDIIKDVKNALVEVLERVATNGGLITYSELIRQVADNSQCEKEFADPVKGGRRRLVDYLDKINLDSANDKGVLLSVVVVGEHGMPDSGFFDKLRNRPQWGLQRWRSASVMTAPLSDIFREELSAVYHLYDARQKIYVFMDLENISKPGRECVLRWLAEHCYVSGVALTAQEHNANKAPAFLREFNIDFIRVSNSGGNAADAALLAVFGGMAHHIARRDFVCFVGDDQIYNQAVELSLKDKIKVLRFGRSGAKEWMPDNKGEYHFFDINDPAGWRFPKA